MLLKGPLSRTTQGRWPSGQPLVVNTGSPQAYGLVEVVSGRALPQSDLQHAPFTFNGALVQGEFNYGPDPLSDTWLAFDQAGGNGGNISYRGINGQFIGQSDPCTVSCWLRYYQAPTAQRGVWEIGDDGWSGWSMQLESFAGGVVSAGVVTTSGGATRYNTGGTSPFSDLFWHLVTVVWNPGAGLSIYLDGIFQASNTTTTTGLRGVEGYKIFNNTATGGNNWEGQIADWRWYRRALTSADVYALYDPATRWDLYWTPSARTFFTLSAAAGRLFRSNPLTGLSGGGPFFRDPTTGP